MKTTLALVFMLCIQTLLFLSQFGVDIASAEIGIDETDRTKFFNYETSTLSDYDQGNNFTLPTDVSKMLPIDTGTVSIDTSGNVFTDTWTASINWLRTKYDTVTGGVGAINKGLSMFIGFVTAFPNAVSSTGLPIRITFSISAIWYILAVFLLVSWIKGNY